MPLQQSKACLDAQNELSLLTAITEILDSTDDETLSPFDTIMDAELLTSPRERENPSVSGGGLAPTPKYAGSAQWGLCRGLARGGGLLVPAAAWPWGGQGLSLFGVGSGVGQEARGSGVSVCVASQGLRWESQGSSVPHPPSVSQFQKFLSLSRPALECESPALEQPKGLRPPSRSGSVSLSGKVSRGGGWRWPCP